jgi:hypothetical protein
VAIGRRLSRHLARAWTPLIIAGINTGDMTIIKKAAMLTYSIVYLLSFLWTFPFLSNGRQLVGDVRRKALLFDGLQHTDAEVDRAGVGLFSAYRANT